MLTPPFVCALSADRLDAAQGDCVAQLCLRDVWHAHHWAARGSCTNRSCRQLRSVAYVQSQCPCCRHCKGGRHALNCDLARRRQDARLLTCAMQRLQSSPQTTATASRSECKTVFASRLKISCESQVIMGDIRAFFARRCNKVRSAGLQCQIRIRRTQKLDARNACKHASFAKRYFSRYFHARLAQFHHVGGASRHPLQWHAAVSLCSKQPAWSAGLLPKWGYRADERANAQRC